MQAEDGQDAADPHLAPPGHQGQGGATAGAGPARKHLLLLPLLQVVSQYGSQLVTSSTLGWVVAGAGRALPEGAVGAGTGRGVVCRCEGHNVHIHRSIKIPSLQASSQCQCSARM